MVMFTYIARTLMMLLIQLRLILLPFVVATKCEIDRMQNLNIKRVSKVKKWNHVAIQVNKRITMEKRGDKIRIDRMLCIGWDGKYVLIIHNQNDFCTTMEDQRWNAADTTSCCMNWQALLCLHELAARCTVQGSVTMVMPCTVYLS